MVLGLLSWCQVQVEFLMCCHTRFSPSLFSKYEDRDDGNDDDQDEVHGDDDDVINVPKIEIPW